MLQLETVVGRKLTAAVFLLPLPSTNKEAVMFRNVLLSIIVIAVVAASGAFVFQTLSFNNREQLRTVATKECSSKILPGAEGTYVYSQFNQCLAGKGISGQL